MNKSFQDLKMEIKATKKTKTEAMLEILNYEREKKLQTKYY